MARQDYDVDPWTIIRALERRIEILERATPLENASITSGTLRLGTPEGLGVDAPEAVKVYEGASIKSGAAEIANRDGGKVGAGGTWFSSDGIVRNDGGKVGFGNDVEVVGGLKTSGQIDPGSVLATWDGARHTIEQITGWLQGDINSVSGRTTTAQSTADTANATANAAKSAADNHGPRITSLETSRATVAKVNQVIDKLNALEDQVQSFHPTKPINPPIAKD